MPVPANYPFNDFLKNWWYQPYTIWRETFESFFHPQFYFGCNVDDVETEHKVLDTVGSYGKQLSQILDLLDLLIKQLPKERLSAVDRQVLEEFQAYEARIDATLAECHGPRPGDLSESYVRRLDTALKEKQESAPADFEKILALLQTVLTHYTPATPKKTPELATAGMGI